MADRPNLDFMLADNLGYGDLSCFGGSVPTPKIDGADMSTFMRGEIDASGRDTFLFMGTDAKHRVG